MPVPGTAVFHGFHQSLLEVCTGRVTSSIPPKRRHRLNYVKLHAQGHTVSPWERQVLAIMRKALQVSVASPLQPQLMPRWPSIHLSPSLGLSCVELCTSCPFFQKPTFPHLSFAGSFPPSGLSFSAPAQRPSWTIHSRWPLLLSFPGLCTWPPCTSPVHIYLSLCLFIVTPMH